MKATLRNATKGCKKAKKSAESAPVLTVVPKEEDPATMEIRTATVQVLEILASGIESEEGKNEDGLPIHQGKPQPLCREAWDFYVNPEAYGFRHERIRNFLMIQDCYRIAVAMGRQIDVDDLNILVQPDGEMVNCSVKGKEFQPMSWVLITPNLITRLESGESLESIENCGGLTIVGQFVFRSGEIFAYSGTPYRWQMGEEKDSFCFHSPVTAAYNTIGRRWPSTSAQVNRLKKASDERRADVVSMKDIISRQLGDDWKPVRRSH